MRGFAAAIVVLVCYLAPSPGDEPKATALKGDLKRGERLFDARCADCHDAFSKEERIGPGLQGISKGKLPDGRKATFELLLDIINTGPAEMTSFKDLLTEQEKADIAAYVLTL